MPDTRLGRPNSKKNKTKREFTMDGPEFEARLEAPRIIQYGPPLLYRVNSRQAPTHQLIQLEILRIYCIRRQRDIKDASPLSMEDGTMLMPFSPSIELLALLAGTTSLKIAPQLRFWKRLKKELCSALDEARVELEKKQLNLRTKLPKVLAGVLFGQNGAVNRSIIAALNIEYAAYGDRSEPGTHLSRWTAKRDIRAIYESLGDIYRDRTLRNALSPSSALFHRGVLRVYFEKLAGSHWLDVEVGLNSHALLGSKTNDDTSDLHSQETLIEPKARLADLILTQDDKDDITAFIKGYKAGKLRDLSFLFHGTSGVGKTTLVHAIAKELNKKVISISADGLSEGDLPAAVSFLIAKYRKANAIILFDECESLWYQRFSFFLGGDKQSSEQGTLKKVLENLKGCVAFVSNCKPPEAFKRRVSYCLEIKRPNPLVRRRIFKNRLESMASSGKFALKISEGELDSLAVQFDLSGGFFNQAVTLSSLRGGNEVTAPNLSYSLDRISKTLGLEGLSEAPRIQIKDLVLSNQQKATLERIVTYTKSHQVGPKGDPLMPNGVTVLFEGPSGTGKTVAAEAMARELGLRFKLVTPSSFLSKWVGETEENIAKTFEEAERNNTLLFLDEAEGLLGSRAEATRSWERTQIDEWLKRLELFRGVFVAATNHKEMLDHAFARRFLFHMNFEMPTETQRLSYLETHLSGTLDEPAIQRLSREHLLSFGEFRNGLITARTYPTVDEKALHSIFSSLLAARFQKLGRPMGLR